MKEIAEAEKQKEKARYAADLEAAEKAGGKQGAAAKFAMQEERDVQKLIG